MGSRRGRCSTLGCLLLQSDDNSFVLLVFLDFNKRATSVGILRESDDLIEIDSLLLKGARRLLRYELGCDLQYAPGIVTVVAGSAAPPLNTLIFKSAMVSLLSVVSCRSFAFTFGAVRAVKCKALLSIFLHYFNGSIEHHLHNSVIQLFELSNKRRMHLELRNEESGVGIFILRCPYSFCMVAENVTCLV